MILLVSDLHLQEERPDITRAFLDFLGGRARGAEALYILGDFFEVWIGDDATSPFQDSIAQALKALAEQGTRLYLMHGNRDFLIGQRFCRAAGCTLLADPSVVNLGGEPVLLMHGDLLCTRDERYQKMRRILRNPVVLWMLKHLPVATRRRLARKLRNESRQQTRMKASDIVDVTPDEVAQCMARHGTHTLVHGHTHRPAIHHLLVEGQAARRIVLGDWDQQGWVLEVGANGWHLDPFDLAPAP
ncbi:UDP-2,3-diacylglucosamine diphosphatase [Pseudomonas sp. KNUC1026]|uniref:UDP-2,3-diacylglucosamine diphosphatase n=1 Tax=Pseudomonas sp. KNUC1026 TaxID=2893890 RepID=UPI001F3FDB9F|nr:UDP-2,3-diacylglucosamine diphosphatase [Pseudomonas sp. KNUC1026]UFH48378.1 UDP-2,3-diacylglucosamine diphosphatase [Pseudomonas sp. KNUC1026]